MDRFEAAISENGADPAALWKGMLESESGRWYTSLLIEQPFISLIRNNPSRVERFLQRMDPVSLYSVSRSQKYKKSETWLTTSYLREYRSFIADYAGSHSKKETIDLYMGSLLKSIIDFSYLIRLLFQPEEGFVFLTDEFGQYYFRGKIYKKTNADFRTAYQISVSNVSSSYKFPIHYSWIQDHLKEVEDICNSNDPVFFKIMSINSKGMIFAYDLVRTPPAEKPLKTRAETKPLHFLEKIIDGSLEFQGNNTQECIRLYAAAMICDGERILVKRYENDDRTEDSLPFIQVSNNETSSNAIKRLLNYYLGFEEQLELSPCGIRHFCVGKDVRSIIFIFRLPLSDCLEKQNHLVFKEYLQWRDLEEYRSNAVERTAVSILSALDTQWSESKLWFRDTEKQTQDAPGQEENDPA